MRTRRQDKLNSMSSRASSSSSATAAKRWWTRGDDEVSPRSHQLDFESHFLHIVPKASDRIDIGAPCSHATDIPPLPLRDLHWHEKPGTAPPPSSVTSCGDTRRGRCRPHVQADNAAGQWTGSVPRRAADALALFVDKNETAAILHTTGCRFATPPLPLLLPPANPLRCAAAP
ncbi:unnamed protein product [Lampetra fluviatilis]